MKSHRDYLAEQIATDPEFSEEYIQARKETEFAFSLARLREERGLTQRQLAELTGIRQPMIARIERGQIPTVPTLSSLAQALNARVIISSKESITIEPATN